MSGKLYEKKWPRELVSEMVRGVATSSLRKFLILIVRENEFKYQNLVSRLIRNYGNDETCEILRKLEKLQPSVTYKDLGIPEFDQLPEKQKDQLVPYFRNRKKISSYLGLTVSDEKPLDSQ